MKLGELILVSNGKFLVDVYADKTKNYLTYECCEYGTDIPKKYYDYNVLELCSKVISGEKINSFESCLAVAICKNEEEITENENFDARR